MKNYIITIRGIAKYPLEKRSYTAKASTPGTACNRAIRSYLHDEGLVNSKRKRKITEYSITIKKA